MIFYFSGTGNSRLIAERLAAELSEKLVFIPEAASRGDFSVELEEGESLGFVFPVYCWAPATPVLEFVERMQLKGRRPEYTYMVTTYGDEAGQTEKVLRKVLGKYPGLKLDAAFGLVMPETYVNFQKMDVDSPDVARAKIRRSLDRIPSIAARIRCRTVCSDVLVGKMAWLKTHLVRRYFYRYLVDDSKFWHTEDCTVCGICEKVCPLGNIRIMRDGPRWMGECVTCDACYHNCPSHAIRFGKVTDSKGQYKVLKEFASKP